MKPRLAASSVFAFVSSAARLLGCWWAALAMELDALIRGDVPKSCDHQQGSELSR
jgi:hypothetical protein